MHPPSIYLFQVIIRRPGVRSITPPNPQHHTHSFLKQVIIAGAGSAGLACAYELSKLAPDAKIAIIEQNVSPGGGQ